MGVHAGKKGGMKGRAGRRESIKARTTKCARRGMSRVGGGTIEDQHSEQLGQCHEGQAQEAVAKPKSSFHLIS